MKNGIRFLFVLSLCMDGYCSNGQNRTFTFSSYLDTYYAYDFINPYDNQRLYVTQYDRHNEFNINHAWIKGAYNAGRVRANLAIQTGTYPINNYGAEPNPLLRMIYEANAGYQLTDKSWVDLGVFGGHFGYESALSLNRELLSPAFSTEYTPYYQTGIRYTNEFSEKLTFRAVVLNGWQNIAETNNSKSVGVAVDYQVSDLLWLSYGNYFGNEAAEGIESRYRFHHNFIAKVTPGEAFSLSGVIDYTNQEGGLFGSSQVLFLTLISAYSISDQLSLAARYEFVKDEAEVLIANAVGGDAFQVNVLSACIDFRPETNVSFKLEPKLYVSDEDIFEGNERIAQSAFVLQAGFSLLMDKGFGMDE